MDFLRPFVKWVNKHPMVSVSLTVIVIAIGVLVRTIAVRSEGILSEPLKHGDIVRSVYGIGTVTANRSYSIKPGVISSIRGVFVKEGDTLPRGARLINIDGVIYRAPFAGTVTYLPFKVGENVFAQSPVLTLVDLSDRYLVVSLEQQGALHVARGQMARLSFDTFRQDTYQGLVTAVYSNDGSFLARIDVSKLPERILPGMTADVAIAVKEHKDVLLVPVAALDNGTIWVKRNHAIARRVEVKTGIVDATMAEIVSGDVQPGDRVLIKKKVAR